MRGCAVFLRIVCCGVDGEGGGVEVLDEGHGRHEVREVIAGLREKTRRRAELRDITEQ